MLYAYSVIPYFITFLRLFFGYLEIKRNYSITEQYYSKMADRYKHSFLPIQHHDLIKFYEEQRDNHWVAADILFGVEDRDHWKQLNNDTRTFIEFILSFFAQFDGIVNDNIDDNFCQDTSDLKEAKFFYAAQKMIEVIHNETYSRLIENFISDEKKQLECLDGIGTHESIRNMAKWIEGWMDRSKPLPERIIAFVCLEGIIFSSAFAAIYWIKKQNILPALTKANEFIARDEGIHTRFGIALYKKYIELGRFKALPVERIHQILRSACEVNEVFIRDALKIERIDMNPDDMILYIKSVTDGISNMLCDTRIYNLENPFADWMITIGLDNQSSFFETKVSEYSQPTTDTEDFNLNYDDM